MKTNKTPQQKEGESLLRKIFNLFVSKKYEVRSATEIDEMGVKGGKRVTIYFKEKDS